jgi:hypothetical protein
MGVNSTVEENSRESIVHSYISVVSEGGNAELRSAIVGSKKLRTCEKGWIPAEVACELDKIARVEIATTLELRYI